MPHELSPAQAEVARMFGPLEGKKIRGGCERCDAFQTVDPMSAGVWKVTVHHDDGCPVLAIHEAAR